MTKRVYIPVHNLNLPHSNYIQTKIQTSFVETSDDSILSWIGYYSSEKEGKYLQLSTRANEILVDATCKMGTNVYRGYLKIVDFKEVVTTSSLKLAGGSDLGKATGSISGESIITINKVEDIFQGVKEANTEIQTKTASVLKTVASKVVGYDKEVNLGDVPHTYYPSLAYGFAGYARYTAASFAYDEFKSNFSTTEIGQNGFVLRIREQNMYLDVVQGNKK